MLHFGKLTAVFRRHLANGKHLVDLLPYPGSGANVGECHEAFEVEFAFLVLGRVAIQAELFQERLKAPNALFLDGTVSAIRTDKFRRGGWRQLGPMIAVFKK